MKPLSSNGDGLSYHRYQRLTGALAVRDIATLHRAIRFNIILLLLIVCLGEEG